MSRIVAEVVKVMQRPGLEEDIMRKAYLDNIRWVTVVLVVIYHVIYMYNAE